MLLLTYAFADLSIVGWYVQHKYVPTVDDIVQKVYSELPDPTTDKAAYDDCLALRVWYFDKYLPQICNELHYSKVHRKVKMTWEKNPQTGLKHVETTTEAFGWTLLDNCHAKWDAICKDWTENFDATSGDKYSPPDYNNEDQTTWVYHKCKWTDSYSGQGKGWDPGARIACNGYKAQILAIREADYKDGWTLHKSFLALIQNHYKVGPDGRKLKKKKSSSKKKADPEPAAPKVALDDDRDEDFGVLAA